MVLTGYCDLNTRDIERGGMRKSSGFTLIELVVVISILAVLLATAAPKFFDLQKEARKSAINGLRASVDSARVLANGMLTAAGSPGNSNLLIEGSVVTNGSAYPTGNAAGIVAAVRFDSNVFATTVGPGSTGSNAGDPVISTGMVYFGIKSASNPNQCGFTYSDAVTTTGMVAFVSSTTLSGC